MKNIILLVLFLISLSSCSVVDSSEMNSSSINQLMHGKWVATDIEIINGKEYPADYSVQFLGNHKLEYCSKSAYDSFCAEFKFSQINANTFLVENERAKEGKWNISRKGENLLICIWSNERCVEFNQK